MSRLDEYTVEIRKELQRVNKVQAKNYKDAVEQLGIIVKMGSGKRGRPSK